MKIIFCLLLATTLSGCAVYRITDVHITGKNIKSVYACGDADIIYKATTKVIIWK